MGHRARADRAAAGSRTRALGHRHRASAAEFRAAGALDRAARARLLADPAVGMTGDCVMRGLDLRNHLNKSLFDETGLPGLRLAGGLRPAGGSSPAMTKCSTRPSYADARVFRSHNNPRRHSPL